jgi:hypothetical protein
MLLVLKNITFLTEEMPWKTVEAAYHSLLTAVTTGLLDIGSRQYSLNQLWPGRVPPLMRYSLAETPLSFWILLGRHGRLWQSREDIL